MQLLPCHRPGGLLEPAPRTSLRADSEHERWEGFWSEEERYYARCVRSDGSEQWFRIEDERGVLYFPDGGRRTPDIGRQASDAVRSGRAMVFSSRGNGRTMLVGTWQRAPRVRAR